MNQYDIYEHPHGSIAAVKQGWSWPAFFFAPIWALAKRMWILGGSLLTVGLVAAIMSPYLLFLFPLSMLYTDLFNEDISMVIGLGGAIIIHSFSGVLGITSLLLGSFINPLAICVAIVTSVIFGVKAKDGWRNSLLLRGYDRKDRQTAAHPEGAVALYLRHKSNAPKTRPGSKGGNTHVRRTRNL